MDKIHADFRKAFEYDLSTTFPKAGSEDDKRKLVYEYLILLGFMMINIRYLSYLVEQGEIKNRDILNFYRNEMLYYLTYLNNSYTWAEGSSQSHLMSKWPGYHEDIPRLKHIWE